MILTTQFTAGWRNPVARKAHTLEVGGSNPLPATSPNRSIPAFRSEVESAKSARPRFAPNAGAFYPEPTASIGACHEALTPLSNRASDVLKTLDPPAHAGPSRCGCSPDLIQESAQPAKPVRHDRDGGVSHGDRTDPCRPIRRTRKAGCELPRSFSSGGGLGIHQPRSNTQGRARERAICPGFATRNYSRGGGEGPAAKHMRSDIPGCAEVLPWPQQAQAGPCLASESEAGIKPGLREAFYSSGEPRLVRPTRCDGMSLTVRRLTKFTRFSSAASRTNTLPQRRGWPLSDLGLACRRSSSRGGVENRRHAADRGANTRSVIVSGVRSPRVGVATDPRDSIQWSAHD